MRIPLAAPDISEDDVRAVCDVMRTLRLSQGPQLLRFEQSVARYTGSPHAVAVSSGTAGLHLSLQALKIGEGQEVIVPSFAFIAVANAVRYQGAVPVFADIDPETLNLDPVKVEAAISSRTAAIIVVHTFGVPADMGSLTEVARRHDLWLIEDACEAIGAEYDSRKVGSLGDVGLFAFYPNKQITTGEGGIIVTSDDALSERLRVLRNQGRGSADWFEHTEIGFSYRLPEINCALGSAQLTRIESILARREAAARAYGAALSNCPELTLPSPDLLQRRISWFAYVVRLQTRFTRCDRDRIWESMAMRGIQCGRYFAPIHLQPAFCSQPHRCGDLTITEMIADRVLALPFFNMISAAEINEVADTLNALLLRQKA
ncbi:MAG TPA: DegT/DnrJ/EryC1/StrS family aminotransferase [Candidatus Angelobacter sp.]|nr:DegT/DnrJ/EryC1/StrS family aminotransferase [Candidatus Angelobacter sp.]